jgi:hypothetical protein
VNLLTYFHSFPCFRPHVYLEEPRKLSVPIVISHYKYKKPTTVNTSVNHTERRWSRWSRKAKETREPPKERGLSSWYRKRSALKRLKADHKKEKKRLQKERIQLARKEREEEFLEQLIRQQQYKKELSEQLQEKVVLAPRTPPAYVKQKKFYHGKATSAKPKGQSKYVTVKR